MYITIQLGVDICVILYITIQLGVDICVILYITIQLGVDICVILYITIQLGVDICVILYITIQLHVGVGCFRWSIILQNCTGIRYRSIFNTTLSKILSRHSIFIYCSLILRKKCDKCKSGGWIITCLKLFQNIYKNKLLYLVFHISKGCGK
jgi:hypothetical protein